MSDHKSDALYRCAPPRHTMMCSKTSVRPSVDTLFP